MGGAGPSGKPLLQCCGGRLPRRVPVLSRHRRGAPTAPPGPLPDEEERKEDRAGTGKSQEDLKKYVEMAVALEAVGFGIE